MRSLCAPLAIATAVVTTLFLSSCYVVTQGLRYLSIRSEAVSVDRALADPGTRPDVRVLLERSRSIRAFGVKELGLKETKNYTAVVTLDSDRLATVVQACSELSFDRWLWHYPIVGALPYRGYFDPVDAEKEASRLRAKGLDVITRPVDAFSTLGYLSDPLFSFMASYDEAELAELILHEMTHATVFIKGRRIDPDSGSRIDTESFNEELATFIGREGALRYLEHIYGPGSPQVEASRARRRDAERYAMFLRETSEKLEAVYNSGSSDDEKRRRKAEIIAERAALFVDTYDGRFETDSYRAAPMAKINNAYLDLYRLYEGESRLYQEYLDRVCTGDMRKFISSMSRIASDRKDMRAVMKREIEAAVRLDG
jgi:predicted aminopeptidase